VEAAMRDRVKVLYIAGQGRSGSTILGNTLGQIEDFVHVGELLEIWGLLISGRVLCGCGVPLAACQKWKDVLEETCRGRGDSFISEMLEFRNAEVRSRNFPWATTSSGVRRLQRRLAKPLADIGELYRAIREVFNCKVIVDSSKHPMYACFLNLIDGVDPYILHLTRDPRAVAYSFFRKQIKDGELIWTKDLPPHRASWIWNYKNGLVDILSKQFRHDVRHVRYEDFVADPRMSIDRILDFADETKPLLPLKGERTLILKAQHTVSGNPSRFVTGNVELRENQAWQSEMKASDRILVTAITWPLLAKYGYRGRAFATREVPTDQAVSA
jgi:Sulfotransferase family